MTIVPRFAYFLLAAATFVGVAPAAQPEVTVSGARGQHALRRVAPDALQHSVPFTVEESLRVTVTVKASISTLQLAIDGPNAVTIHPGNIAQFAGAFALAADGD